MYVPEDVLNVYGCRPPAADQRDAIALARYRGLAARARSHGVWWKWWHGAGWSGAGAIVRSADNKLQALDEAENMLKELLP